jgi:nucleoside-diphosphate-sugar epimerase
MPNRSLYQLVDMVQRGLFFFIGTGAIANYVYVDDVADALVACAMQPRAADAYVLSDDRPMDAFIGLIASKRRPPTMPEWVARGVATLAGWVPGFPLTNSRVDALTRRVHYSPARIQRELGYTFRVSIEEGLRRLVASRAAA